MYELIENPIFEKYDLVFFTQAVTYIGFKHVDFELYINTYDYDFDVEMINNNTDFNFDLLINELDIICAELRNGLSIC